MKIFEPISLRGQEFQNRIWIPPMCMYSASNGVVSEFHLAHLGALAMGGAGLIIAEATGVVPEGRITGGCPGMWDEQTAEGWRPVVDLVHKFGAKVAIQLNHAGRKAGRPKEWQDDFSSTGHETWQTVGPSDNAFPGYEPARAMSAADIAATVQAFAAAAERAVAVGFDAVEIHAAHGYLMHQFLSPLVNERTDEYGGSLENRCRLLIQTAAAVRGAVSVPLLVRISATDWVDGGWDLEQSVWLCNELRAVGVDLIDVSTGGAVPAPSLKPAPGYQVEFATAIRNRCGIPTSAVGLITDPQQAAQIVEAELADVVMVGRAALRDPHWPWFAAEALGVPAEGIPMQLARGRRV